MERPPLAEKTVLNLKEKGLTIVLTSHFMDEVEVLCDIICILKKGKPNEIDLAARLLSQPIDYLSVVVYPVGYGTLFYLISKLISAIQTSIILRI